MCSFPYPDAVAPSSQSGRDRMTASSFIFADMSGFTALTEAHGDEAAAELVTVVSEAVRPRLADRAAEEVKRIGDTLMIRGQHPAESIKLAIEIVHEVGRQHGLPAIRAGLHTGPALERDGDWFGATVNLAARIAGLAAGGEVLATDATIAAADQGHNFSLEKRGRVYLRNVSEPVLLFAVLRRGVVSTADLPLDPVCRMAVAPESAVGTLQHAGTTHFFCSLECASRFAADPERYTR